jgi:Caspase domain
VVETRHALLIGVPHYEDPAFNEKQLEDAVTADIAAMRAALSQSGYEISECGTQGSGAEATPTRIRRAIKIACSNVPVGGTLLIYYSGHGLMIDGKDYLVPTDAYRGDARSELDSLVRIMPADSLAGCRARLVVFFADSCRTDPAEEPGGDGSGEPGGEMPFPADGGHFVQVMGCGAGQVCHYDTSGSSFTETLAKVLDARNPARNLKEVVEEVSRDMSRRSRQSHGEPQEPVVRYAQVLQLAGDVEICDGDERAAAWRKAVEASPLLMAADLRERVQDIVAECARRCGKAERTLRERTGLDDPWTDQDYPVRVLRQCEALAPAGFLLPDESALLIAAPFLREAVLAAGTLDAAGIDPASLERTYTPGLRGDLELTHEMHQHLVRRANGLREQARTAPGGAIAPDTAQAEAADHLAMWLVHRWLNGRVQLWDTPEVRDVGDLGRSLMRGHRRGINDAEERRRVETLLLAVGAEPDDERFLGRFGAAYMDDRLRLVATVLWLGGTVAADLRRLPPVVADLLGTGMELPFSDVQDAAARRAEWRLKDSGEVDLDLVCEHPAMHETFASIVERAAAAREAIRSRQLLSEGLDINLPVTFTAKGLRAAIRQDDEPAYAVPLSRFQIAEEKVRELLMGKQIYGDQSLAIRELYQNALDACRWRQVRQEYQHRKNGTPAYWSGLIRFRQGTDDAKRPFIECEDNGVGMDMDTLKHVFASAGERFVYGHEFRAEQAAWAELDPPLRLISNSQFGVGVFSYFMLADEIAVTTRPQHRNGGVAPQAYEVRIASSGSLVQIRQVADKLPDGGTQVRLYLGGDVKGVSVLRTLRELLWVAEHRVEVISPDGSETWNPGELRRPNDTVTPLQYGEDLWWVSGEGGIAADGIKTGETFYGLVVNLRREHRPKFTVDRNELQEWDKESVAAEIEQSIPGLVNWSGFTLYWLWRVADLRPETGQQIYEYAARARESIIVGETWAGSSTVPVDAAGCLSYDDRLFVHSADTYARWFTAWRAGAWRNLVAAPTSQPLKALAQRTEGFPVPDPIDASLLGKLDQFRSDGRPTSGDILRILANSNLTVIAQLRRLRRYAITGLDLSETRRVPPILNAVRDDDAESLLPAFAAWSQPSGLPEMVTAGPLLWASWQLEEPLGEVFRRLRKIIPEGWSLPLPELGDLATYTCSMDDAMLLSREKSTAWHRWCEGELSPAHLMRVSDDIRSPFDAVIAMCDKFSVLGVRIANRDAYPDHPDHTEMLALRHIRVSGQKLNQLHLILIAGQAGISVGAAYEKLARLEHCGLLVRPAITGPEEFMPGHEEVEFIEKKLLQKTHNSESGDPVSNPWRFIADVLITKESLGRESERRVAQNISQFIEPDGPISREDLFGIAYRPEMTMSQVAGAVREIYPRATLPSIGNKCANSKGSLATCWALGNWGRHDIWHRGAYSIVSILSNSGQGLGDLLSHIASFRTDDDGLPACDESLRDELNRIQFDDYDLHLLTAYDEFGWPWPVKSVDALRFVQSAGRFGWTLAQAQAHFAPLATIGVILDYPQADFPEEIVYWYDLQVLTTHFDGQAPVIAGKIDQAYLERAAVEIFDVELAAVPEKAARLRERLRIYQPLFGFQLDDPVG